MNTTSFALSPKVVLIAAFAVMAGAAFSAQAGEKVEVCHMTSSETHNVQVVSVSTNALDTHLDHGDVLYDEVSGCEQGGPSPI